MLGICINCKEHAVQSELFNNEHICQYLGFAKTDFVTGKITFAKCYDKNKYGECKHFNPIEEGIPDEPSLDNPDDTGNDNTSGDNTGDGNTNNNGDNNDNTTGDNTGNANTGD